MEKEDLKGKPEEIKEKIVMGRLKKKYEEMSLLSQKWLKDDDKTVEQVLKEKIAKLGEKILLNSNHMNSCILILILIILLLLNIITIRREHHHPPLRAPDPGRGPGEEGRRLRGGR